MAAVVYPVRDADMDICLVDIGKDLTTGDW